MPRSSAVCSHTHNIFELLGTALVNQNYAAEAGVWMAIRNQSHINVVSDAGSAINLLHKIDPRTMKGKIGLGLNASRPISDQVFIERIANKEIAVTIDAPSEVCREIRDLIVANHDLELGVKIALQQIKMPFVVIAMTRNGLFAARSQGRKPLSYGKINNDIDGYYFASQSGVLGMDAQYMGSVLPGEMVFVNQSGAWHQMVNSKADQTRCLHEDLFRQKQDNIASSRPISTLRRSVGHLMGQKFREDIGLHRRSNVLAVQIPDGGLHYLLGFHEETGYNYDPGAIIKIRYPLIGFSAEDEQRIAAKYNPVSECFGGKKVIVVDDMIKSGTRIKYLARRMRTLGAKEVHGVVSGMLCHNCPYGNDDYTEYFQETPQQADELELDSLTYPDKQDLIGILSTKNRPRCGNCLR